MILCEHLIMKSVCSGFFQQLLLFSAVAFPDVVVPMSNKKECKEQERQKGTTVVIRNIGIKMCQLRCIETGGCLRFDFDIDTLTCRLRLGDSNAMEKKKEIKPDQKTHSDVTPGPCSSTSCSLGARCLESRSGKPVCVKSGRVFYPSKSQQQRTDKKSGSAGSLLHEACREGDLHQVQTIISKGQIDIDNREEEYGRTPVMLAARGGYRDVFQFLVQQGCNMSLLDNTDNNILHMACYGGQIAIVKYALSLDTVDINSSGQFGRTCVMVAAHRGNMDLFKYLVNNGGNASLSDDTGDNSLHIACRGGHAEMVKFIISQDVVDVNSKGRGARTVAMVAANFGYRNIFDLCACAGCNLSAVDAEGNNVLHVAIIGGHIKMVKHVLAQRLVNINSRGMNGKTPLMFAAVEGRKDVFDIVMSKGGDASLVDVNSDNILHCVCRGGHIEMMKYVISQNITNINSRGHHGRTPLMVAAAHGHRKVFNLVMSKGGNASRVDNFGHNILHLACRGGHVEMVKHIISQALADINKGQYEGTPLMVAAVNGHRDVFDFVMSKGGNASLVDNLGHNILHWACRGGHVEMVKHIISQNLVEINSKGHYGRTPQMVAAFNGHRDVFDLVMSKGGDASLVDRADDNILHWACRGGHVEMVKHIISQNVVDINRVGNLGRTPLMVAAFNGHRDVFDFVMSKGGDASLLDVTSDNILHRACSGGYVEMVKHIISRNFVDINSKGYVEQTPLLMAATKGYKDVFDLVMSKGGNASLVDVVGENILHCSCRGGHVEMVKHIISKNFADINSRSHEGKTPLMLAVSEGHRDVFDIVMSKGGNASLVDGDGDNILHCVCEGGNVEMVKQIISHNFAEINSRGNNEMTPMMVAADHGQRKAFDLLMSNGGDASLVDANGDNILHFACRRGHVEMVKHIISQNLVDINSKGQFERTPLMVAAVSRHRGVFDLLLSKGGDASLVDNFGHNILHLACVGQNTKLVKHIISKTTVDVNAKDKNGNTAAMLAKKTTNKEIHDLLT